MPRGYWCILVAFVGWLSLAAAQPKDAGREPASGSNDKVTSALNNLATALQKPEKPSKHDEPCRPGENKRSSDLCAQWKAADAAQNTANYTLWFGLLGTLIGAATLAAAWAAALYAKSAARETKRSADESKRTADAAEKGLRHTEDITRAQLRAYLAAEKETFRLDGVHANLTIYLRNVGQTPAHEVTTARQWTLEAGRRKKLVSHLPQMTTTMGAVGPKVPIESYNDLRLKPGVTRALRAGIGKLTLTITVNFVDIFGERWLYRQTVWVDRQAIEANTVFTASCETGPPEPAAQGELPLKKRRKRKVAKRT